MKQHYSNQGDDAAQSSKNLNCHSILFSSSCAVCDAQYHPDVISLGKRGMDPSDGLECAQKKEDGAEPLTVPCSQQSCSFIPSSSYKNKEHAARGRSKSLIWERCPGKKEEWQCDINIKEVGCTRTSYRMHRDDKKRVLTCDFSAEESEQKMTEKVNSAHLEKKKKKNGDEEVNQSSFPQKKEKFRVLPTSPTLQSLGKVNTISYPEEPLPLQFDSCCTSNGRLPMAVNAMKSSKQHSASSKCPTRARHCCNIRQAKRMLLYSTDLDFQQKGPMPWRRPPKDLPRLILPNDHELPLNDRYRDSCHENTGTPAWCTLGENEVREGIRWQPCGGAFSSQCYTRYRSTSPRSHSSMKIDPADFSPQPHRHFIRANRSRSCGRARKHKPYNGASQAARTERKVTPLTSLSAPTMKVSLSPVKIPRNSNASQTRTRCENAKKGHLQHSFSGGVVSLGSVSSAKKLNEYLSFHGEKADFNSYRTYMMNAYLNELAEYAAGAYL